MPSFNHFKTPRFALFVRAAIDNMWFIQAKGTTVAAIDRNVCDQPRRFEAAAHMARVRIDATSSRTQHLVGGPRQGVSGPGERTDTPVRVAPIPNHRNNPTTQVFRIRSFHSCWPC